MGLLLVTTAETRHLISSSLNSKYSGNSCPLVPKLVQGRFTSFTGKSEHTLHQGFLRSNSDQFSRKEGNRTALQPDAFRVLKEVLQC